MKPLSIREIRQAVAGKVITQIVGREPAVRAVCTDTRKLAEQCLFVALRGENHDGHQYLAQAAGAGAIAAIVDQPPAEPVLGLVLIQVADTRIALGKLASAVRKQLRSKIVGVGGSNGKTSTKHLIHAALSGRLRGSISPKSFNNDIGVPLTLFAADASQDYVVVEMGTNHPGEMKTLAEIALPDIAVITNVSAEHLEGLGDLDGVRREEASIITGLSAGGFLVVNGDDAGLLEATSPFRGKRLTFGFQTTNDIFPTDIRCGEDGVRFRLNTSRTEIFVPLLGRHTAVNALAAIAVARRLGVPDQTILEGLSKATGPEMRLNLQKIGGVTILNDAYNANPASMVAALQTLAELPAAGRRIAVLGDMRELGEASAELHRELGRTAASHRLDLLVCVGEQSQLIAAAAQEAGLDQSKIVHMPDSAAAAAALPDQLRDGDLVLLKGSRGIRLEVVATAIAGHSGTGVPHVQNN
jgi:UDP-N-acetylmuramoyl-tripeptide--D-alanyl-D-alanine ligase